MDVYNKKRRMRSDDQGLFGSAGSFLEKPTVQRPSSQSPAVAQLPQFQGGSSSFMLGPGGDPPLFTGIPKPPDMILLQRDGNHITVCGESSTDVTPQQGGDMLQ
ncbi:hypothetical protein OROGR_012202 [Orobanche gracilis]